MLGKIDLVAPKEIFEKLDFFKDKLEEFIELEKTILEYGYKVYLVPINENPEPFIKLESKA